MEVRKLIVHPADNSVTKVTGATAELYGDFKVTGTVMLLFNPSSPISLP